MNNGFPGFSPAAVKFLRDLKKNNEREWFQPRKELYETEWKAPMTALVAALYGEMQAFAPEYVGDPARSVMRIYRDTRFSKVKTPYKTHVAAGMYRAGLGKDAGGQFYFHISPEEIGVAAGFYAPAPEELRALRQHLAEHHEAFRKLTRGTKLKALFGPLQGETLTRAPKGFPVEHAAEDLLRHKQFYFSATLDPALATTPALYSAILDRIRAAIPALEFLNAPVLGLAKRDENRFLRER